MVAFTQFLLPYGERRATSIDMASDVELLAAKLVDAGYRFECEVLRTGEVNVDCCGPALDGSGDAVIAIEVCPNGPDVPEAVARVVRDAYEAWVTSADRAPVAAAAPPTNDNPHH